MRMFMRRWIAVGAALATLAFGCGDEASAPPTCGPNACNETVGGGTCDDATGHAVCTCNTGYAGARCDACASGYVARAGACFPATCESDSCNESHGGGTCHDLGVTVACTCNTGFIGPTCRQCAAGWHPDGSGGCTRDARTACNPAPGGPNSDAEFPGGVQPGESFTWVVPADAVVGTTWYYHCRFHGNQGPGSSLGPRMSGSIKVR